MSEKIEINNIRPGDIVRIYQKTTANAEALVGKKEGRKTQAFEGLVLARKHGNQPGATITVRKEVFGVGVERIFPIYSPIIEKIEILKKGKPRRAKLYYLREATGHRAKIKER